MVLNECDKVLIIIKSSQYMTIHGPNRILIACFNSIVKDANEKKEDNMNEQIFNTVQRDSRIWRT